MKKKSRGKTVLVSAALFLAAALLAFGAFAHLQRQRAAEAERAAEKQRALEAAVAAFAPPETAAQPETEAGALLLDYWRGLCRAESAGELTVEGDEASLPMTLVTPDTEALGDALAAALSRAQSEWAAAASRQSEVYDETGALRRDLAEAALPGLLCELPGEGGCARVLTATLRLRYDGSAWLYENRDELDALLLGDFGDPDALAETLLREAVGTLAYLPLHYSVPEDALAGYAPDPAGFGETEDPAVIEALLQRPEAQRLIGGQTLVWNAEIEFLLGSPIRYYLDETILVLVWQEEEAREIGTFSEIFLADGSQLRRKIAGDTPFDMHFETTGEFARQTRAVLAIGGDMYQHGRACGIVFYRRELCRFEPDSCDTCYINGDGDLLFSYRGQFQSEEEALRFAEENDVLFSLVFGPVLIDGGEDVTPPYYPWGQVNEEYARAAIGQLGRLHYLTMNLNHGTGRLYHLATLRDAADAMLRRGCEKAYTLDGGQTATTVFGGQLVNPVQFGWQRQISDIVYFATALPEA